MKNLRSLQNIFFIVFCLLTLLFQMHSASRVYSGLDLDTVESHEIFSLNANSNLATSSNDNTRNAAFQLSNEILEISAERGQKDSEKTIFQVGHSVAAPLRQDLMLTFSIFAHQLNLKADAGRLFINLQNSISAIMLSYVVGYKESDWEHGTSSYFFFQVGNNTDTWFNDERNVWNDLISKNVTLESTWDITSITFGCISYEKGVNDPNKMSVFFNASETSLYYEESTFTKVIPTLHVSWTEVYLMIADMLVFIACSVVILRTKIFKRQILLNHATPQ